MLEGRGKCATDIWSSCAQWSRSLHQAASLELAGALGAFCHSSRCSLVLSIKSLIYLSARTQGPHNVWCQRVLYVPQPPQFCRGHIFTPGRIPICQEKAVMRLPSKMSAVHSQLAFNKNLLTAEMWLMLRPTDTKRWKMVFASTFCIMASMLYVSLALQGFQVIKCVCFRRGGSHVRNVK